MTKTKHSNNETVVKCPVNGCEHEGLSRGIHLHIRQSSGDGHGPNGDVPENLSLDELEVVGSKEVKMDYPEHREVEDVARLCPYCGRAFSGFHGVKIHVGQKQGQGVHPEDATEITKEDCPIAQVDDDMNVIEVVEERSLMPTTKRRIENDADSVSIDEVVELIEELKEKGYNDCVEIVSEKLL